MLRIVTIAIIFSFIPHCKEPPSRHGLQYARGTDIRLRAESSVASKSLGTLQGGEQVEIIGKSEKTEIINSYNDFWYKVIVQSGPLRNQLGWIYGAFVSTTQNSPETLASIAENDSSTDFRQKIQLLQEIRRLYPRYNPHALYPWPTYSINRIAVFECWEKAFLNAAKYTTSDQVLSAAIDAIRENRADILRSTLSCDFIYMKGYCVGDPLPGVPYEREIHEILSYSPRIEHHTWEKGCAKIINSKDTICLNPFQFHGRWYIDNISIADCP